MAAPPPRIGTETVRGTFNGRNYTFEGRTVDCAVCGWGTGRGGGDLNAGAEDWHSLADDCDVA